MTWRLTKRQSDKSAGNPDLLRLDDFSAAREGQWELRLCEKGKALVTRQVLVAGTEKPSRQEVPAEG